MTNVPSRMDRLDQYVRSENVFPIYELRNAKVQLAIVPDLGARIISLKNLATNREWLWHPPGQMKLFRNRFGDNFVLSPLVGVDECLPTIAPCDWQGRTLPDHGEVWSEPWTFDKDCWKRGLIKTSIRLKISPFDFERTIELSDDQVRIHYTLTSRSEIDEQFIWAMHPLLRIVPGDQLILPASTRALLENDAWLDSLDSALPDLKCFKLFARPVTEGAAAICNKFTGDRIEFEWSPAQNNTVGLWLTRGGWHGHHHFAVEPTNADHDALAEAAARKHCGVLPAGGSASWQVRIRLGP